MSKIVLYRNCRILEDKNMQVDDILTYLGTLSTPKVYNNAQLIKNVNDVDLSIKVALDQDYMEKDVVNNYNYCSISNDTSNADTYFYFIRKINWKSKECLELELHLDILNTFKGEYTLTKKTAIERMHKNRFYNKTATTKTATFSGTREEWTFKQEGTPLNPIWRYTMEIALDSSWNNIEVTGSNINLIVNGITQSANWEWISNNIYKVSFAYAGALLINISWNLTITATDKYILKRMIDFEPENINPIKYKIDEQNISDNTNMKWYLVYQTPSDLTETSTQVVNTLLYPENKCIIKYRDNASVESITTSDVITSDAYYLTADNNGDNNISVSDNGQDFTTIMRIESKSTTTSLKQTFIMLIKDATKVHVYKCYFYQKGGLGPGKLEGSVSDLGSYSYVKIGNRTKFYYQQSSTVLTNNNIKTTWRIINGQTTINSWEKTEPAFADRVLISITELDRTDKKLIKCIELPYAPFIIERYNDEEDKFIINNGEEIDWEWKADTEGSTKGILTLQKNTILSQFVNTFAIDSPLDDFYITIASADLNTNANRNNNYESKLYHSEFYYNKYIYDSFSYNINLENINTSTLQQGDAFNINYVVSNTCNSRFLFDFKDIKLKYSTNDYDNLMVVTRNNDITLYNSNYLNYLRIGYNYDVKTKQISDKQEWFNLGMNTSKSIINSKGTSIDGINIGLNFVQSAENTYINQLQAQRAIEQKKYELSQQATNISGSEDIDLLRYYTQGDKMKVATYRCSGLMKQRVADLFYYCGYNVDGIQGIPNTTSRYWFNFIQCLPVYDQANNLAKLNKQQLDELTNKYQNGVTVYHHHTTWDFDQVKENWEVGLI